MGGCKAKSSDVHGSDGRTPEKPIGPVAAAMHDLGRDLARLQEPLAANPVHTYLSELALRHRQLTEAVARLEERAMFDALTGLPNKRHFEETLHMNVSHAQRQGWKGAPQHLHVLFIDLDHFKEINDDSRFGHEVGDRYLAVVSAHMRGVLHRESDMIARIGGDEFAALILDCDEKAARSIAERIREAVHAGSVEAKRVCAEELGLALKPEDANVTASIGLASLHGSKDSPDALLKRADQAMYEAKNNGKDRVVVSSVD